MSDSSEPESAVTPDHFQHSRNQNEDHPLPSMDSYVSWYDKSKRMGEDCVLAANSDGGMRTCALRLGGVISSIKDCMFRTIARMPRGIVIGAESEVIDHISAKDVCRAMILAGDRLHDSSTTGLAGTALFLSENAAGRVNPQHMVEYFVEQMNSKYICIPKGTLSNISQVVKLFGLMGSLGRTSDSEDILGVPFHLFLRLPLYEQTFDNSKAREILGFAPQYSWQQAVDEVVEEFVKLETVSNKLAKGASPRQNSTSSRTESLSSVGSVY